MSRARGEGPPRYAEALLRRSVPRAEREAVVSELAEAWRLRRARVGRAAADRWYQRQVRAFLVRGTLFRCNAAWSGVRGAFDRWALETRAAWRRLVRAPASSAAGLGALALATASSIIVISVVDAVLLRPLPFDAPERLLRVHEVRVGDGNRLPVAPPAYLAWRDAGLPGVDGITASVATAGVHLDVDGVAEHVAATQVGHGYFGVLGIEPRLGRAFTADEDEGVGPAVAMISSRLHQRRFGGDPAVIGRTIGVDGVQRTIVGVTPGDLDTLFETDVWMPLMPDLVGMEGVWGALWLDAVVRLRADAGAEALREEMDRVLARHPDAADWRAALVPLDDSTVGDVRAPLLALLAAVVLVVVAACANVGGLLTTRAIARRAELGVRAALGAGRGFLTAGLVAEGLVLAGCAGVLGVAIAFLALDPLLALVPVELPRAAAIAPNPRVLAWAVVGTLATGLAAGLVPASVLGAFSARGPGAAARPGRTLGARTRRVLVVSQVAVAASLLVGAGLLGRTFLDLVRQDMGFEPAGLVTVELRLPSHLYPDDADLADAYASLLEAAAGVPGVQGAALTRNLPLSGRSLSAPVSAESGRQVSTVHVAATPGYLDLLGVPTMRGRSFDRSGGEVGRRNAVVVSEGLARALFGEADPVGRSFTTMMGGQALEIIGVVRDVRQARPGVPPQPTLYRPLTDWPSRGLHLVVRTAGPGPAPGLTESLRVAVVGVRAGQTVEEIAMLETLLARSIAGPRFYASLLGAFSLTALLLSGLGLNGLLAGLMAQRRREVGIRVALGAGPSRVHRQVLGEGMTLATIGVAVGLVGSTLLTRLVSGLLFEVEPVDATTMSAVALVLLATTAATAWPVARRAARVDPAQELKA